MNRFFTFLISLIFINYFNAQTIHYCYGFQRPQTVVSGISNIWKDAKVDNLGNAYVLAMLAVNQNFNSQTYSVTTNRYGKMLIKYNSSGVVQWVTPTNFPEGEKGEIILLDNNQNPIVVGNTGTITASLTHQYRLSASKYNRNNGTLLWNKVATSGTGDVKSAAISPDGNIYMGLTYRSSNEAITWDNISSFFITTSSPHPIIIRLDSNGFARDLRRVQMQTGINFTGEVNGITCASNNELYLTGNTYVSTNSGVYVIKSDSLIATQWFIKTGSNQNDYASSIDYLQGSVYVTTNFAPNSIINFGNSISSTVNNFNKAAVIKINQAGIAQWMTINTISPTSFLLVKLNKMANGNIGVYGNFQGANVPFGGISLTSSTYLSFPQIDAVLFELDSLNGSALKYLNTQNNWAKAQIMASAPDNSHWIGGHYRGTINIGSTNIPQYGGNNDFNFFIARVTPAIASPTDLKEISADNSTNVFPNPFNSLLFIDTPKNIKRISLVDLLGHEYPVKLHNNTNIETGNISEGVYFLNILYSDDTVSRNKIIKTN